MINRKNEYNNNAAFVCLRYNKTIGGKTYQPGDTVDVSKLSVRKKMQLFGANIIGYDYMVNSDVAPVVVEEAVVVEEVKEIPKPKSGHKRYTKKPQTKVVETESESDSKED